jgi:hypothetical protein
MQSQARRSARESTALREALAAAKTANNPSGVPRPLAAKEMPERERGKEPPGDIGEQEKGGEEEPPDVVMSTRHFGRCPANR